MIEPIIIYDLWLREMIKFRRARFRILSAIAMPVFMLIFMGIGFRRIDVPGLPPDVGYFQYFVPGMIGMTLLFTGSMVGMVVLMDRQVGFLKEVMVTPANRISIILGRIAGGATTSFIQACIMLFIAVMMGFQVFGPAQLIVAFFIMITISIITISASLAISSRLRDPHDYYNIMNIALFPVFLLSGALFPLENLPAAVRIFAFLDPLTYGVDALRGSLAGVSLFPVVIDCLILLILAVGLVFLGARAFETGDIV